MLILLAVREDVRAMQRKQLKLAHIVRSNYLSSGHNRYLGAVVSTFRALQTACWLYDDDAGSSRREFIAVSIGAFISDDWSVSRIPEVGKKTWLVGIIVRRLIFS